MGTSPNVAVNKEVIPGITDRKREGKRKLLREQRVYSPKT
jgi:hypothetical protein